MTRHPSLKKHSYIHLSINPPCADALRLRKSIQDGLAETFGITASGTYLDILWIAESGFEVVIRLSIEDASKVMAAVVITPASPRFSLIKQTNFLPSLLSKERLT
ncbi:hypothetical protein DEU56DRAFT_747955 [Suillus clintonianus]|uniref:uncharacterized protein n=1 Tax=Suillus clintonianus TaxID=1904413 RepID=UPI001B863695|nr:uncharacterized protein DEU56DRAFT_747955 [Suillus clintonianus]KAG2117724.1 hypothetical protein DEU56DRAFT_747955 [Suillus clintonianus]